MLPVLTTPATASTANTSRVMRGRDMHGGSTERPGQAPHDKHTAQGRKAKSVMANAGIEAPTSASQITRLNRWTTLPVQRGGGPNLVLINDTQQHTEHSTCAHSTCAHETAHTLQLRKTGQHAEHWQCAHCAAPLSALTPPHTGSTASA